MIDLKLYPTLKVNIINKSSNPLPKYAKKGDAGMDICASEDVWLKPFNRALIPTGIYLEIPDGYECQIRSRSGMAIKKGISVLNSPGTIDSGYRGEIKVILKNHCFHSWTINKGDKIAQMVFAPVTVAEFVEVDELTNSERGDGGFGSTGK